MAFCPFRPVVRTSSFHVEDTGSIPVRDRYSFSAAFSQCSLLSDRSLSGRKRWSRSFLSPSKQDEITTSLSNGLPLLGNLSLRCPFIDSLLQFSLRSASFFASFVAVSIEKSSSGRKVFKRSFSTASSTTQTSSTSGHSQYTRMKRCSLLYNSFCRLSSATSDAMFQLWILVFRERLHLEVLCIMGQDDESFDSTTDNPERNEIIPLWSMRLSPTEHNQTSTERRKTRHGTFCSEVSALAIILDTKQSMQTTSI